MNFVCKYKLAFCKFVFVVLFCLCGFTFAEEAVNPPLPIADSVIVKNLNVKNTEIRDLLQGMAVQYGLNLFLAPEVRGPVTVNFNKQPLKDALRILLQGNGYEYVLDGNVIRVQKPAEKAAAVPKPPEKRFVVEWRDNALTIDVEDAPLEKVVRSIVESTGKNVLLEHGNPRQVSLYLNNLPFERAVRYLAESVDMECEEEGEYSPSRRPLGILAGNPPKTTISSRSA